MSKSRASLLQSAITKASGQVQLLRDNERRERDRVDELRIVDRAESARAHAEGRPDCGRGARQQAIRIAQRLAVAADELVVDAERALFRLIAKSQPKTRGRTKGFGAASNRL